MNRKTVLAVSLGVLIAALACLIAGLITYFVMRGNAIAVIIGIFMMSLGVVMAVVPIVLLTIILINYLIQKKKK